MERGFSTRFLALDYHEADLTNERSARIRLEKPRS